MYREYSGSDEGSLNVWNLETGQCRATFEGHTSYILGIAVTPDGKTFISGAQDNTVRVWDLSAPDTRAEHTDSTRYTNAKVVLVGESGAGKTGLALRLAEDRCQETSSTHGMNVWPLKLPGLEKSGLEREVWLWDFAGQPDYRLIHQLYMDETALALLVIDPQRVNPLEPLEHWEKALQAAVRHDPAKMLIAARCDRGGFTISQRKIDQHCTVQGYLGPGCDDGLGFASFICIYIWYMEASHAREIAHPRTNSRNPPGSTQNARTMALGRLWSAFHQNWRSRQVCRKRPAHVYSIRTPSEHQ